MRTLAAMADQADLRDRVLILCGVMRRRTLSPPLISTELAFATQTGVVGIRSAVRQDVDALVACMEDNDACAHIGG